MPAPTDVILVYRLLSTVRRPLGPQAGADDLEMEFEAYIYTVEQGLSVSKLDDIKNATKRDNHLQTVICHTVVEWPKQGDQLDTNLKPFYEARNHLPVSDGLLLYDSRIVVPRSVQRDIFDRIHHDGHQGISKSRSRAIECVWWPGMSKDIKEKVESCSHCQTYRISQTREPLMTTTLPERAWQRIAADLFQFEQQHYICVTDYYSRYLVIMCLPDQTFARWGIPDPVVSNNGPQFSSCEFNTFAQGYGFETTTFSPRYSQANGSAERAVAIAKCILRQKNTCKALMVYRATPNAATGHRPAELLVGRRIKTTLPTVESNL